MDQKAFTIVFLGVLGIAVVVLSIPRFQSPSPTASINTSSPSPSSGLDPLFEEQNQRQQQEQQQQMQQQQTQQQQTQQKVIKQYRQFPGVLSEEQLKNKKAIIKTGRGNIEFEIFTDAPKAASNFIFLTSEKFYDGLTFHRVEPGFVIQGGDPLGNGTGGPGYKFEDEKVTRKYNKGIVAMANSGPNTNGSQFFIMLEDNLSLPPAYTIFGRVIKGQDVVGTIEKGDVMEQVIIADLK